MIQDTSFFDIAIIGAGFSGSMVAVHLASLNPHLRIALIDEKASFGRGIAYGTHNFLHLLNVPAGKMGAFPDQPGHFAEWLGSRQSVFLDMGIKSLAAEDFVPRRIYGTYLRHLIEKARRGCPGFEVLHSLVTDMEPQGNDFLLNLSIGRNIAARKVVLALGNFPPGDPPVHNETFHRNPRYLSDPWDSETLRKISRNDDILILGSGLTALDLIVSLKEIKPRGVVHVISRRGVFPQAHRPYEPQPSWFKDREFPTTIGGLVHLIRSEVRKAASAGIDWRAVIDALRPHSQRLWQGMPLNERKRFMRHIRPYWEAHRHRCAAEVLAAKEAMVSRRQLAVHRGRVLHIDTADPGLTVTFLRHGSQTEQTLRVAYAVNCTGPECNYQKLKSPLIVNLLARGLIHPDPLYLGLTAAADGAVLDDHGRPSTQIFTLGSAAKGMLYETTAVPELRVQAKALAERLLR